jgi:dynein intermediate chain 2
MRTHSTTKCREKNLEKTIKEARLKAKKEANKKDEGIEAVCDEDLTAIEAEFSKNCSTASSGAIGGVSQGGSQMMGGG